MDTHSEGELRNVALSKEELVHTDHALKQGTEQWLVDYWDKNPPAAFDAKASMDARVDKLNWPEEKKKE